MVVGIQSRRGERPFQDLLALIDYLEGIPYIDNGKGTIVGSSSSAYLVNKVLGHEVAKKVSVAFVELARSETDLQILVLLCSLPKRNDRSSCDLFAERARL